MGELIGQAISAAQEKKDDKGKDGTEDAAEEKDKEEDKDKAEEDKPGEEPKDAAGSAAGDGGAGRPPIHVAVDDGVRRVEFDVQPEQAQGTVHVSLDPANLDAPPRITTET